MCCFGTGGKIALNAIWFGIYGLLHEFMAMALSFSDALALESFLTLVSTTVG